MILIIPPRFCCIEAVQQRRNERETFGSPATNEPTNRKDPTMRKEKARQHVLLLLIGVMLTASVGGCFPTKSDIRKNKEREYDETLRVEEIDDGVYMIAASMDGTRAGQGSVHYMKENVLRKAREHCAQENKAIKLVSREGQGGSSSASFGGLTGGGLLGMSAGSSSAGAEFDIIFKCRERTTPAPTPDAP